MITNDQKTLMLQQYYDRGVLKKEIRSYEVSLWTLQDDFITVLKWSDVEQKGRIEHPKMVLNIDGTQKFTFSIPMYYRLRDELIENPNWYNVENGMLLVSLRKLKVIFNKGTADEGVFDFVITKVTETHEKDILTCDVESEGLAFQELGKIGYKISLSQENFELVYENWQKYGNNAPEPIENIDYWCQEAGLVRYNANNVDPHTWYYDVRMNWGSFEGGNNVRDIHTVYEESYVSSWNENTYAPATIEQYREKARAVEIKESNLYNITQTIAETFEIFCRYEFLYDENYHIIGRIVVFYNNFFGEGGEGITLQYPYSSSKISREMDSAQVTTKLFVRDVDDSTTLAGINTIMNAPPNKSREDYILNFDYMLKTNAITQEQFDAIEPFENNMRSFNNQLIELQQQLSTYQNQKPELEAKISLYQKSIDLAQETILQNQELYNALDGKDGRNDGLVQINPANADLCIIQTDTTSGVKFINLASTNKGIDVESIHVFLSYHINGGAPQLDNRITDYKLEYDEFNNVSRLILNNPDDLVYRTTDWSAIFKECYIPDGYRGNVDLSSRKIIPHDTIANQGWTPEGEVYDTVCAKNYSQTVTDCDGNTWRVGYTPILADGTVLSTSAMGNYLREILTNDTDPAGWLNKDKAEGGKKVLLGIFETSTDFNNFRTALSPRMIEWDGIRAAHDWFGHAANPDNIEVDEKTSGYTYITDTIINDHTTSVNAKLTATRCYLIYKFTPKLYYDNIIKAWQTRCANDQSELEKVKTELGTTNSNGIGISGLLEQIETTTQNINSVLVSKNAKIKAFERMMGPALREGYWQPETYDDYGDHHKYHVDSITLDNNFSQDTGNSAKISWDSETFEEEDKLYYEITVNQTKKYYPCIDLASLYGINNIPTDLDEYSLVWKATNLEGYSYEWDSIKDLGVMGVGSQALIKVVKRSGSIIPVLMLVGAKNFTDAQITRIREGSPRLEKYKVSIDNKGRVTTTHESIRSIGNNDWFIIGDNANPTSYPIYYPRIKFSSLSLKANGNDLTVKYNNNKLEIYKDYSINTRNTKRNNVLYPEYFVTIKPEVLIKYGFGHSVDVDYVLSNANTAIYLDAIKVSKENAWPKVSYNVATNILDTSLTHTLYNKLAQIVMVNDTDLKFENVFGYISGLTLDLDNCDNDEVEVKNYKTKFEDLFSTIVAQTEAMKRSGAGLSTAISGSIPLSEEGLSDTLDKRHDIMEAYLDSYFDSSEVVRNRLRQLFKDAGKILGSAQSSLNKLASLSTENQSILSSFAQDVGAELTSKVTKGPIKPSSFKLGDMWIQTDVSGNEIGRYMAIASSDSIDGDKSEYSGFVRTYDGSLASISGASLNMDAMTGIIDISAENSINIKSGNSIYIAADSNVDIVGNRKVNIGGTEINLCTMYEKSTDPITGKLTQLSGNDHKKETTGINLIAGEYEFDSNGNYTGQNARVLIRPTKIEMGASELELAAASKISLLASTGDAATTSAVSISAEDGVWIGAGAGLRLYSGQSPDTQVYVGPVHRVEFHKGDFWIKTTNVSGHYEYDGENGRSFYTGYIMDSSGQSYSSLFTIQGIYIANANYNELSGVAKNNDVGWSTYSSKTAKQILQAYGPSGASVELNAEHLLFGFSNMRDNSGTAIEMTEDYMVFAAGNVLEAANRAGVVNNLAVTGATGGLIGAKFTSSSIGLAVTTNSVTTAVVIDKNGFTVGSGGINVTTDNLRDIQNGSYTRINKEGIELGSLADLYINTDNFKLQTYSRHKRSNDSFTEGETIMALGNNLQNIDYNTVINNGKLYNSSNQELSSTGVRLLVNKSGVYVKGTVYADAGEFNGVVHATAFSTVGNDASLAELKRLMDGSLEAGLQKQIDNDIQTWSGSGTPLPYGPITDATNKPNGNSWYDMVDTPKKITSLNYSATNPNLAEWSSFSGIVNVDSKAKKEEHIGDIYYDIGTLSESATGGQAFRWIKDTNYDPAKYYWISLGDTVTTSIAADVAAAENDIIDLSKGVKPITGFFGTGTAVSTMILFSQLGRENGLTIMGKTTSSNNDTYISVLRASSNKMGFFELAESSISSVLTTNANGEYIFNESVFNNVAKPLLWYNTGNLYLAGTLYASRIQIGDESSSETWSSYFLTNNNSAFRTNLANTLKEAFDEAGEILIAANNSLKEVQELNVTNNAVLETFKENIVDKMTPTVYIGPYHGWYFKAGDIWKKTTISNNQSNIIASGDNAGQQKAAEDNPYQNATSFMGIYLAMENWDNVYSSRNTAKNGAAETKGWNCTYDGSLSQITGTSIDIDAGTGDMIIQANRTMNLRCFGTINMAGTNVNITGQNSIMLGGPSIQLGAATTGQSSVGSIKLIASASGGTTTHVDIESTGIVMESAKGIQIKSGEGIKIYYTDADHDHSTAGIELSDARGVWIGSDKAINLSANSSAVTGTNFSMTPKRIILGAQNDSAAAAIRVSSYQILLATGDIAQDDSNSNNHVADITTQAAIGGVQIKKDYIGLAMGNGTALNTNRSIISIRPDRILIGVARRTDASAPNITNILSVDTQQYIEGSYIDINNGGSVPSFTIGTTGIFRVKSEQFYFDSNPSSNSNPKLYIANNTQDNWSASNTRGIKYSTSGGLEVKGTIKTTSGTIAGWTIKDTFIANGLRTDTSGSDYSGSAAKQYSIGLATDDYTFWSGLANDTLNGTALGRNSAKFYVKSDGTVHAELGNIAGWVMKSTFFAKTLRTNTSGSNYDGTEPKHYKMGLASDSYPIWAGLDNDTVNGTALDRTKAKFYVQSNGHLHATDAYITGTITATSFQIKRGNAEAKPFFGTDGKILGDYFGTYGTQWHVNGIENSTITIDSVETDCVVVGSSHALVMGANCGIYLPKSASNMTNTNVYVSVTKAGILLNATKLELQSGGSNKILLNTSGITLDASSLKIQTTDNQGNAVNKITLGTSGITLASQVNLTVDAKNIILNSGTTATDGVIFQVNGLGANSALEPLILFERNYGGYIGGWLVNHTWMWSGSRDSTVVLVGSAGSKVGSLQYNSYNADRAKLAEPWAFYCGADWPERCPVAPTANDEKPRFMSWAPLKISKDGEFYGNTVCIGTGPRKTKDLVENIEYSLESDDDTLWENQVGKLFVFLKVHDADASTSTKALWAWKEIDLQRFVNDYGIT